MFRPDPVALPGLAALTTGSFAFAVALLVARSRRRPAEEGGATRATRSIGGVMTQGFGIFLAGFGPVPVALDPLSTVALLEAAAVALLMAASVALFAWASRMMGRNWSIVARTRSDHQLVQAGPFAWVRHPIYVAMALFAVALAIACGHTRQLVVALPVFALGTYLRIRHEEALLRAMFGPAYDAYAARVKRFAPGLF